MNTETEFWLIAYYDWIMLRDPAKATESLYRAIWA